jgi:hypothetical protein
LRGSSNGTVESEMKRGDFARLLEMAQPSYKAALVVWLRSCVEASGEEWEEEDGAEASIQFNSTSLGLSHTSKTTD